MNLSSSLELIWRFAASEMAAAQFKEIEPEHFCMALLKFAELPAGVVEVDGKHAEIAKAITTEAEMVRKALQKCGIESTSARRKLRGLLGKGRTPCQDGRVHRSAASRALFKSAVKLAEESESENVTPLHLLTALVHSPTPAIAQAVLGKAAPQPQRAALPLLDKHGRDLVKAAFEGTLRADSTAEAHAKAVLQILSQKDRKSVLLVSDNNSFNESIAISVALALAAKDPPIELKGRRLIDVAGPQRKGMLPAGNKEAEDAGRLPRLLAEAASHSEIILLVPAVEAADKTAQDLKWVNLLRETLAIGKVQLICRVTPMMFAEHFRKDAVWKRHAEAVWLDKYAIGSIPREL